MFHWKGLFFGFFAVGALKSIWDKDGSQEIVELVKQAWIYSEGPAHAGHLISSVRSSNKHRAKLNMSFSFMIFIQVCFII